MFALGLIIAGAVSGLAAGVLGIGGGIVIVPVLYHVMAELGIDADVRVHVAIATSLAAMIPAALAHVQNAKGEKRWVPFTEAVALFVAVALGCATAKFADGRLLTLVFALTAIPIVLYVVFDATAGRSWSWGLGSAFVLGSLAIFLSTLTGIGGDTIRNTIFWRGRTRSEPVRANGAALTLFAAVAATIGFAIVGWGAPGLPPDSLGYVNILGFALIAPVLLATEPAGAALAHVMDQHRLRLVFAGLIVIVTARMLWDAFT